MSLSVKELELANYLVRGFTTSEISRTLNKKPSTISTQKSKVYQKLKVNNIIELLAYVNKNRNSAAPSGRTAISHSRKTNIL